MASGSGDDSASDLKLCSDFEDVKNLARELKCDFPRRDEDLKYLNIAYMTMIVTGKLAIVFYQLNC